MNHSSTQQSAYDVIIVGAGVVGCAMARRFSLEGARVLVLERAVDILDGASKGNSGILHTGFDAPVGSLEQRCVAAGYRESLEVCGKLGLSVIREGALVVAWTDDDVVQLDKIVSQAHDNGVSDVSIVSANELQVREPGLSKHALAAVNVPGECVIDPWTSPYLYLLQALKNGAQLQRNAEVTGGAFDGSEWQLRTTKGEYRAGCVINCAGLYGDQLDQRLLGECHFEIRPRKGQFLVFDKAASRLLSSIILPVPTATTKGVVVCKSAYGNVLVGPTAEEQDSRDDVSVDAETLDELQRRGAEIIPALQHCSITATYAGIRPATEQKDYRIKFHDRHYVTVGGIRSTGLSAALGIARYVFDRVADSFSSIHPPDDIVWPKTNALTEFGERDWRKPGNGGVICHCELVTRREIEQALKGPLSVASLSGLKRRTRVTMGRCQVFYCSARLSELTAGFSESLGIDDV